MKKIIYIIFFIGLCFSYSSSSSSYNTRSLHIGLAGETAESTNLNSRSTLTYQQPSNNETSSASYQANLGWLELTKITEKQPSIFSGDYLDKDIFPFLWRVNRDARRTRILTGLSKP